MILLLLLLLTNNRHTRQVDIVNADLPPDAWLWLWVSVLHAGNIDLGAGAGNILMSSLLPLPMI